ncbi:hypothetical protein GOODEAATRI_033718, partial [Goodea atripinnis]
IRKAWDGMTAAVLLSKIGPYKLFYFDIFRTAPGRELESEVKLIVFLTIPNLEIALVKKQGINVRWESNTRPHPLQPDSSSCGVFAIK